MKKIILVLTCIISLNSCYKCVTCDRGYGICIDCASTSQSDTVRFCDTYSNADSILILYALHGINCDTAYANYYMGHFEECETKVVKQYEQEGYLCN